MTQVPTPKTQSQAVAAELTPGGALFEKGESLFPSYFGVFMFCARANPSILRVQSCVSGATLESEFPAAGQLWQSCNAVNNSP